VSFYITATREPYAKSYLALGEPEKRALEEQVIELLRFLYQDFFGHPEISMKVRKNTL
jgi:hypothetical protein